MQLTCPLEGLSCSDGVLLDCILGVERQSMVFKRRPHSLACLCSEKGVKGPRDGCMYGAVAVQELLSHRSWYGEAASVKEMARFTSYVCVCVCESYIGKPSWAMVRKLGELLETQKVSSMKVMSTAWGH